MKKKIFVCVFIGLISMSSYSQEFVLLSTDYTRIWGANRVTSRMITDEGIYVQADDYLVTYELVQWDKIEEIYYRGLRGKDLMKLKALKSSQLDEDVLLVRADARRVEVHSTKHFKSFILIKLKPGADICCAVKYKVK